jgi:uncharacterized membrane-anchored protein
MTRDTQGLAAHVLPGVRFVGLVTAFALLLATPLSAQDEGENQDPWADKNSPLHRIEWTDGGQQVDIGAIAEFTIPAACRYAGAKGARDFLHMTENVPTGREQGVLLCRGTVAGERPWFVIFSFDPSGYVKDDEGKKLDSAKILAAIRAGTEQANKVRKAKGWEEMIIDGWVRAPYYDPSTHNLTWSIRGHATSSGESINHSVRLLGRRGVLHADLVADPAQMTATVATFDSVIATTAFLRGERYSEWRKGDKVAAYGLTALVAGGAGVAAAKLGLFGKLGKYFALLFAKLGKLVVVALVGLLAGIKSLFTRKKPATA